VRFTATARRHVRREQDWWLENRDHTEVFADELDQALKVVALLPGAGSRYPQAGVPGLRRMYVPKVACHVYHTFDDAKLSFVRFGALAEDVDHV
jgi:hypothetical protein